ncbi:MAG: right-handed parallel beta-helix repeat-containing protein [Planctomycetota bacterium]
MASVTPGPAPIPVPGVTYWVDADGGDDLNDGLAEDRAFRSLTHAVAQLSDVGGDRLWLKGTFRETLLIQGLNSGDGVVPDPNRPTVVQCAFAPDGSPYPMAIDGGLRGIESFPFDRAGLPAGFGPGRGGYLDRGIEVINSNYLTLSGLAVRGIAGRGIWTSYSSHLRLEHVSVEWTSQSAMLLTNGDRDSPFARDLVVADCRINQSNLGLWQNQAAQLGFNRKSETLSIVQFDGFEIARNHVSNSLAEGIDFKFGSRNGQIYNNVVENMRGAQIYVNEGEDTDIYHNLLRGSGYYDPQDGSGLKLSTEQILEQLPGSASKPRIGATAIIIATGDLPPFEEYETGRSSGIRIFENVISWSHNNGLVVWNEWRILGKTGWALDNLQVFNNVFHRCCQAPGLRTYSIQLDVGVTNSSFVNNIVIDSGRPAIGIWGAEITSLPATVTLSNNLLWRNESEPLVGEASIHEDPRFVLEPATPNADFDFRLQSGSPAIDRGLEVGLGNTGGTPTDIGAFQTGVTPWEAGIER